MPSSFTTPLLISLTVLALAGGCDRASNLTSEEHLLRAKEFQMKGDVRGSIIEYKNAVQKDAQNAQARWLLGQAYLRAKLADSAIKELEAAQKLGVNAQALNNQLADALMIKRDYQAVLDRIQIDTQTPPQQQARSTQLRADALLGLGKASEACALYDQATALDANLSKAYIGLATCKLIQGQKAEARQQIERAIQLDPDNPDYKIVLANFARAQQDNDTALRAYAQALKNEPANLDALAGRTLVFLKLKRIDEAQKDIEAVRSNYPKHFMGAYLQAALAIQLQQFERGRDLLLDNLKNYPSHLESHFLLGTTYAQLGQIEQAIQSLNRAIEIAPLATGPRTLVASLYLKSGQPKAAYATLQPMLRGRPDATQLGLAGEAQLQLGDTAKARVFFEEANKAAAGAGVAALSLGRASLAEGNAEGAMGFMREASASPLTHTQAELFMAKMEWQAGKRTAALARLAGLERTQPKNLDLPLLRGSLAYTDNDLAAARSAYDRALKLDPRSSTAILGLREIDLKQGRTAEAGKRLKQALDTQPDNEALLLAGAIEAQRQGQQSVAHDYMTRAAKANPNAFLPQQFLVQSALDNRQPKRALELARAFADRQPDNTSARQLLANTQFSAGDYDNALAGYKRLLVDRPSDAALLLQAGLTLLAIDRPKDARPLLQKSVAASQDAFATLIALASLEYRTGEYGQATVLAKRLNAQFPQAGVGRTLLGDIHTQQGQYVQAVAEYREAFKRQPNGAIAVKLSAALGRSGQTAEAGRILADWLKSQPADIEARQAYANMLQVRGQLDSAIAQYEFLVKRFPDSVSSLNNLATLLSTRAPGRALSLAKQAYDRVSDSPYVADTYGWLLFMQNRAPEARPLLEKAWRALPDQPTITYHYAATLAKTGETAQAKRMLQTLLALPGTFPEQRAAQTLFDTL
jgi:putative PEP-CTERM system TPR-repeat lipoprotein